jgi:hypothetical protein
MEAWHNKALTQKEQNLLHRYTGTWKELYLWSNVLDSKAYTQSKIKEDNKKFPAKFFGLFYPTKIHNGFVQVSVEILPLFLLENDKT